jgi:hypothetical protein
MGKIPKVNYSDLNYFDYRTNTMVTETSIAELEYFVNQFCLNMRTDRYSKKWWEECAKFQEKNYE